jgi:hypothetical protein
MWPAIRLAYGWVYQAAHLLANAQEHPLETLKQEYGQFLEMIKRQQGQLDDLGFSNLPLLSGDAELLGWALPLLSDP